MARQTRLVPAHAGVHQGSARVWPWPRRGPPGGVGPRQGGVFGPRVLNTCCSTAEPLGAARRPKRRRLGPWTQMSECGGVMGLGVCAHGCVLRSRNGSRARARCRGHYDRQNDIIAGVEAVAMLRQGATRRRRGERSLGWCVLELRRFGVNARAAQGCPAVHGRDWR